MKNNRPDVPLFATVNVTGLCNLRCKYCFFQPRDESHMPLLDFHRVIDELAAMKVFFVNLSGGEPFTHPQIADMLEYAHDKFSHVVVLSNGTLIRPAHLETIRHIAAEKGGFPIQISLDSVNSTVNQETRGKAEKIMRNLERLSEVGADIVVAMVITRFNAPTLVESIRTLSAYTRFFHLMTVQEVPSLDGEDAGYPLSPQAQSVLWDELRDLREELDLHFELPCEEEQDELPGTACGAPCMAAFSQLVIDPSLQVRPCDRCVQTVIGDLHDVSLADVWHGPGAHRVIESPVPYCRVQAT